MKKFFILTLAIGATLTSCRKDWISPDDLASIEAGYNTRITALTADLAAATTEVDALEGTITTLESTIADLEANGIGAADTIAALQAQVSAELVKVATLQAEVEALEIALATSGTDADELADQIEILNEEIDELKEEVETLTADALVKDALIAQLEATVADLTTTVDTLFDAFDATTTSTTLVELSATIAAVQTAADLVPGLEAQISDLVSSTGLTPSDITLIDGLVNGALLSFSELSDGEFGSPAYQIFFDSDSNIVNFDDYLLDGEVIENEDLETTFKLDLISTFVEFIAEFSVFLLNNLENVLEVEDVNTGDIIKFIDLDGDEAYTVNVDILIAD